MQKKVVSIVTITVILIMAIAVGAYCSHYFSKKSGAIPEITSHVIVEQPRVEQTFTLEEDLKSIGKLETQEYTYTLVRSIEDPPKKLFNLIKIPFTSRKVVFTCSGTLIAGIDFENVKIDKNDTAKIITVILPRADELSNNIDLNSCQVYDERTGLFAGSYNLSDYVSELAECEEEGRRKAKEHDIFTKADNQAKILMDNLIKQISAPDGYEISCILSEENEDS